MTAGTGERLVLLFLIGALLIGFPVLSIFNQPVRLGGVPLLYLYLFGIWGAGIVAVLVLVRRR